MTRRIVDLSIPLDPEVVTDPPFMRPSMTRQNHRDTVEEMQPFFPGLTAEQLTGGEGFAASETLTLSTHNGTHLDAPWHYHPTMNNGERAIAIDEVPLDWCMQPGVKLDFRHLPDGHVVTADEVEAELARIGHTLSPLDIVLINTRAGSRLGEGDFLAAGIGMGREATLYLTRRGVRVAGTDAWSWDAPFPVTARRVAETGDTSLIWEGHKAGREIGYCHMEKLTNLESLPPSGFTVICLPVKVKGGSAGWTRAVAVFDDALEGAGA